MQTPKWAQFLAKFVLGGAMVTCLVCGMLEGMGGYWARMGTYLATAIIMVLLFVGKVMCFKLDDRFDRLEEILKQKDKEKDKKEDKEKEKSDENQNIEQSESKKQDVS